MKNRESLKGSKSAKLGKKDNEKAAAGSSADWNCYIFTLEFEIMDIFEKILFTLFGPLLLFMLFLTFIYLPIEAINSSECLEQGYPESKTTLFLDGYCINLDGAVTGKVKPL